MKLIINLYTNLYTSIKLQYMGTTGPLVGYTPYAYDKKTSKFAQGLDFSRFFEGNTKETLGKNKKL